MSAHDETLTVIECDAIDCPRRFRSEPWASDDEAREDAARDGWVFDGGDLCPDHAHLEEKVIVDDTNET